MSGAKRKGPYQPLEGPSPKEEETMLPIDNRDDADKHAYDESEDVYMTDPRSKSVEGFIAGLLILSKYMKESVQTKYSFGAEHDIIYIWVEDGAPDENSEEGLLLSKLGFHFDEDGENWAYFT